MTAAIASRMSGTNTGRTRRVAIRVLIYQPPRSPVKAPIKGAVICNCPPLFFGSTPIFGNPLKAARDIASQIPVVEGGPAERGEPYELVPGVGELEGIPEHSRREDFPESGEEPFYIGNVVGACPPFLFPGIGRILLISPQSFARRPA
jgi:hypothetical protein